MDENTNQKVLRLQVSIDVAYQTELMAARNELLARLGFSRTLLALQMQVLGASIAIFGVISQGKYELPAYYTECICGIALWISYAMQNENVVNQSSIGALAIFTTTLLNTKYEIASSPTESIWGWDVFLAKKHPTSSQLSWLSLSLLSPSLILNLLLSVGALAVFWIASAHHPFKAGHAPLFICSTGLLANAIVLFRYFKIELAAKFRSPHRDRKS